ncbi:hypothetical protein GOODEAATRI_031780 [Goodea atripinnis]|uniref:Uncharacterized protein n=1 Tax=Goodea atripinnis TaxID=208336 RepID=A0ABV0PIN8_9TELE
MGRCCAMLTISISATTEPCDEHSGRYAQLCQLVTCLCQKHTLQSSYISASVTSSVEFSSIASVAVRTRWTAGNMDYRFSSRSLWRDKTLAELPCPPACRSVRPPGMTKTLGTVLHYRNCTMGHNMNHRHSSQNPGRPMLEWLQFHLQHLGLVRDKSTLVAHNTFRNNIALLELKIRHDVLENYTLWQYNTQFWLTWIIFLLTYLSVTERTAAYLVIIRPGTNSIRIRRCPLPNFLKQLRHKFPWLTCFCQQVLNCLTPTCHNMRTETLLSSTDGKISTHDTGDLCYMNLLFNQEKCERY